MPTSDCDDRMKIIVSGASGLIGSALVPSLTSAGHDVVRLVRRPAASPAEATWDPRAGTIDSARLAGADAVIHLAGAGVGDHRWTDAYKREIRESRVLGTRTLAEAIARLEVKPSVFVSGSAIGYYGDTGSSAVDETSGAGTGFLADVVVDWEKAAAPAAAAGIRTAFARTGLVVSGKGGAWGRLFPIFKAGIGGTLGSGRQYWSFISLRDEVAALTWLLTHDISGPVNLTAPVAVTNAEVTAAMGRVLGRPTLIPVPAFALKSLLGEFSQEVLGSTRVVPSVLEKAGFTWLDADIDSAIRSAL